MFKSYGVVSCSVTEDDSKKQKQQSASDLIVTDRFAPFIHQSIFVVYFFLRPLRDLTVNDIQNTKIKTKTVFTMSAYKSIQLIDA